MMRIFALACALFGADAVRRKRQTTSATKFIEGVPILNYNLAYEGASLSERENADSEQAWIVVLKPGIKNFVVKQLCKQLECKFQGDSERGVPFVTMKAGEATLKNKLAMRIAKRAIKFIEPDIQISAIPEMPAAANSASWGLDRVGAPKRANEGAGSHVYVLDTGVRPTHADFGGRVVPTLDMSSGNAVYCGEEASPSCTNDAQGHGTHCAGTVAGESYGVAPKATIHAVKVLSDSGSGSFSWSFTALDFLATSGERPTISSMSLGGKGVLASMGEAVASAVSAGVVVVVAGGNSNSDACGFSPAFAPAAITVGSTTKGNSRSSFSNYGVCTDIWAPGSDITSASHRSDTGSATFSGTSMACPHVSGGAALILENDPTLSADEVLKHMLKFGLDGAITGLKGSDTNRMLYVGADGEEKPLPPPPTPAPPGTGKCGFFCPKLFCGLSGCAGCDHCTSLFERVMQ